MSHSTTTITFDKPDKTYLPEDTVNGQVTITNTKPLKTRSVFIKWIGYSKTSVGKNPVCQHNYINGSKLAWVSKSELNEMPVGTHEYPFSFTLPKDSAPTFKRSNGQNEYKVVVEFDTPWWFNTKVEEEFRVTKETENLAKYRKNTGWIWNCSMGSGRIFSSGPISVKTTMPNLVYQPGETFDVKLDIANNSGAVVRGVKLLLIRETHWHARHQQTPCEGFRDCHLSESQQKYTCGRYETDDYHKIEVASHSESTFTFPFTIPAEVQTPSFKSGLMTHGYRVLVEVYLKGTLFFTGISLKIFIGDNLDAQKKKMEDNALDQKALDMAPPPYTS